MTPAEMKRMSGRNLGRLLSGSLLQHDAENPNNLVLIGESRHKEPLRINRRAAESDLLIYLNFNSCR